MPNVFAPIRCWWHKSGEQPGPVVPFAIPCACGQTVTGQRKKEYQVVPCPGCKAEVFVLPLSPFADPGSAALVRGTGAAGATPLGSKRPLWFLPALAAVGTMVVLAGAYLFIKQLDSPGESPTEAAPGQAQAQIAGQAQAHWKKADEHIALGHFTLALEELDALAALQQKQRLQWLAEGRLAHKRKEIALYADLSPQALEELLEQAIDLPEAEWQRVFAQRYQGKAVILDMEVTRLFDGNFRHSYVLQVGNKKGRIDLVKLPFFTALPFDQQPRRVLFGARLAAITRTEPNLWSIEFTPDSAVLLTDPHALAICCPPLADPATEKLLASQKQMGN